MEIIESFRPFVRDFAEGMGQAVAERTILRKKSDESWETWGDVASRVAIGNALLCPDQDSVKKEYKSLRHHISKAVLLMSGRHLQHGDVTQPSRTEEIFSNCSTSATSFGKFLLLLSGSGVGRCYDDDMMLIDWDNAPNIRCVMSHEHPDFDWSAHESVRDASHKYGPERRNVIWHKVADSREGWAKALEIWETMAFEKIHKDKTLILDFSDVRCKGSSIGGMQNRPASGPVPLMNAFMKSASLKGSGLDPWRQTLYIDHYFSECVLVGGARRSARMSTKFWKDPAIFDFITVKRPVEFLGKTIDEIIKIRTEYADKKMSPPMGFLWSSNNSITVDREFWSLLEIKRGEDGFDDHWAKHARKVFKIATEAAYADGTGEPGFINVDKLTRNDTGWEELTKGDYVGSRKYQVDEDTKMLLGKLARVARRKAYYMIVNPSLRGGTRVMTENGAVPIETLEGHSFKVRNLRGEWADAECWLSGENEPLYKVTLYGDHTYYCTAEHKWPVFDQTIGAFVKKLTTELKPEDQFPVIHNDIISEGTLGSRDDGFLIGWNLGDGWITERHDGKQIGFICSETDTVAGCKSRVAEILAANGWNGDFSNKDEINVNNKMIKTLFESLGITNKRNGLPVSVFTTTSEEFRKGLIDGLFSSDGTISQIHGIELTSAHRKLVDDVSELLGFYGIKTAIFSRKTILNEKEFDSYSLKINHRRSVERFNSLFRLTHSVKQNKILTFLDAEHDEKRVRNPFLLKIKSIELTDMREPVWDIHVKDDTHCFQLAHCITGNCGEIPLTVLAGFCTIADVVPYHADSLAEAEDAFRSATRALIRVNLMDSIYHKEVERTNRIGVGMTGVHEFAWKFFRCGFRDLINPDFAKLATYGYGSLQNAMSGLGVFTDDVIPGSVRAAAFWMTLSRFNRAVREESVSYSAKLGVVAPHTCTTIKPSGSVSKLFGLTEGWHLPALAWMLRWVQFRHDDPLVDAYARAGYPTRELTQYSGTVIVGFPTAPTIAQLGMGDKMVLAGDATPEEQYQWLMLGEKYWLIGVKDDGTDVDEVYSGQISYTLKFKPEEVDYKHFRDMLTKFQSQVKACSVMPQVNNVAYEYLPEEAVTKAQYEEIAFSIQKTLSEDIGREHLDCATGACPIDIRDGDKTNLGVTVH